MGLQRYETTDEELKNVRRPVKLKRRDIKVSAILDIEAQDWTTYVVAGVYIDGLVYREFWWDGKDSNGERELVELLFSLKGTIWAHFGGGYDYKWLLDWAAALGYQPRLITAGSRIVSMKVEKAHFCDSFALVPISLEKFTAGMGVKKIALDLECNCGKDCGGYCRIKRNMTPAERKVLSRYLRHDCESLYGALMRLKTFAEDYDLDLGLTVGSSAWRNVRRKHGIPVASLDTVNYKFCSEAYFGGRVQRFQRYIVEHGYEHDVNAMYPWCLATFAVPVGDSWRSVGVEAQKHYANGQPGVYRCLVEVPEMFIPPLPHRFNKRTSISFPFGNFSGTWTLPELKYAESLGTKVTVLESLTWEREAKLFAPWIRYLWKLRLHCMCPKGLGCSLDDETHDKDSKASPLGTWLKFLMNSMIGKMGSNPEQEKWDINLKSGELRKCKCEIGTRNCLCGAHRQISDYAFVSKQYKILDCAKIECSSYAISYARIALHKRMMLGATENGEIVRPPVLKLEQLEFSEDEKMALAMAGIDMMYCDTDSNYRKDKIEDNDGDELGQWQYIGEVIDFICHAPKVYSYMSLKKGKMVLTAKAKGIALPVKIVKSVVKGEIKTEKVFTERPTVGKKYTKETVRGFRSGARHGKFFEKAPLTRTLNERSGDRRFIPSKHSKIEFPINCTYPPHVSDLKA